MSEPASGKKNDFFKKVKAFSRKITEKISKGKTPFKRFMSVFCRIMLCVAVTFFIVYAVSVLRNTREYTEDFFSKNAHIVFDRDIEAAEDMVGVYYERLYELSDRLSFAKTEEEIKSELSGEYRNILYISNGLPYDVMGDRFGDELDGYAEIVSVSEKGISGCSKIYYDEAKKTEYIAFFVPVRGSVAVDGIVSRIELHEIVSTANIRSDGTEALILMDRGGAVYSEDTAEGFGYTTGENLRSLLKAMTPDGTIYDRIGEAIGEGRRASFSLQSNDKGYTLSLSPISALDGQLWIVNLIENDGVLSPELAYVRHIVNICIMTILCLIVLVLYFYGKKRRAVDEIRSNAETPNGCPGKDVFRINVTKLLQAGGRQYALAVIEIRQFRYIRESLSEKEVSDLLDYVAKVIQSMCNVRETYGYIDDGKFAMTIFVESERSVKDRVRLIESVAGKNPVLGSGKSKRKFNIGLSMTQASSKQSFGELLGYAEIACEKAKNNINVPYVIFNEQINSERIHNERIEAEMETALASGEFRLFLQPKYNVAQDRIDSAEALVRWFDTKKGDFRFPGEFIGLFESNGFITKLDHFMYIETLKFLSSSAERFDKIVPISVNVSMVTVSDPGFLNFYVENKKKYNVGDNFIVIEFTESFAMEDYQKIRDIVDTLHQNGILCSLDDFGSGYSSLGTLKNIPFDELKFDRLFLDEGFDRKNDDIMLEAMFSLARSMGIRVVQEGVETKEVFDSVIKRGCDVIQGYYYAKAIPVEEYKLFINSNTSIKYKSRVK